MKNKIIWKGIDSSLIDGLMICELPPITKPQMRANETYVDGVDGSIIEELGYEAYKKKMVIGLYGNYDIDKIIEYFTGSGNITFSNEPDKYYKATIISEIEYQRYVRYRVATIEMIVQPYKYSLELGAISLDTADITSYTITNKGNVKSKPIIKITGSGEIEFKLNGITMFTYLFPEGETTVTLDSEKQDAYVGSTLKNRNMNGNFIELSVGQSVISWTGTVTALTIENWSRWV